MKRILAIALSVLMLLALLAACNNDADPTPTPGGSGDPAPGGNDQPPVDTSTLKNEGTTINIYSFTKEVPNMLYRYKEMNPSFDVEIKDTIVSTQNNAYQAALDLALASGEMDIYCAEAAFVLKYTQGDFSQYALPYSEIGISKSDTDAAQIAPYTVEIGTRNGALVGLAYQLTGGAMIYRRSIAKATWGSDAPADVEAKVGAGSGNWDKFFEAAEELKAKGYAIVSGDGDIWHSIENSSNSPWLSGEKLVIDPKREAFLDLSKKLYDNGYANDSRDWEDSWFVDMGATSRKDDDGNEIIDEETGLPVAEVLASKQKPVFTFFGPAWLINYVMADNAMETSGDWAVCAPPVGFFWGGTWVLAHKDTKMKAAVSEFIKWVTVDTSDNSLQMHWAAGSLFKGSTEFAEEAAKFDEGDFTKDTVSSAVVMGKSNGDLAYLGGQNMYDGFIPASKYANGKCLTQFDEPINDIFRDQVRAYYYGEKDRDAALKDFRQIVVDKGFAAE